MTGTTGVVLISDVLTIVDCTNVSSIVLLHREEHIHWGRWEEGPQCEQR